MLVNTKGKNAERGSGLKFSIFYFLGVYKNHPDSSFNFSNKSSFLKFKRSVILLKLQGSYTAFYLLEYRPCLHMLSLVSETFLGFFFKGQGASGWLLGSTVAWHLMYLSSYQHH